MPTPTAQPTDQAAKAYRLRAGILEVRRSDLSLSGDETVLLHPGVACRHEDVLVAVPADAKPVLGKKGA